VEKLSLLIRDPGLRHRLGRAARQTVEENFSAARWALRVGEILQEAAETRRPGPTREGGVS
jgi:glycosyltransferase involved in cell wall biosynthesis